MEGGAADGTTSVFSNTTAAIPPVHDSATVVTRTQFDSLMVKAVPRDGQR